MYAVTADADAESAGDSDVQALAAR